jgi:hypothetical protein
MNLKNQAQMYVTEMVKIFGFNGTKKQQNQIFEMLNLTILFFLEQMDMFELGRVFYIIMYLGGPITVFSRPTNFPSTKIHRFSKSAIVRGVYVMVTIFCDFRQFSAKKLAFFSKTNVMIKSFS